MLSLAVFLLFDADCALWRGGNRTDDNIFDANDGRSTVG